MIQLFRRIRQSLLQREQFSRYLLYALGEIVLVVIGILIALQINVLYQKRMDLKAAQKVLSRLVVDLDADYDRLTFIDSSYAGSLKEIREIYSILGMASIDNEALVRKAAFFDGADIKDVNSVRVTFDEMVSSGNIYKLDNNHLIRQIIEYYRLVDENTYQSREDRREFRRFLYSPEMLDYFYIRSAPDNKMAIARAYLSNTDSKNFKRLVQTVNWSSGLIGRGKRRNSALIEKNRDLRALLETEIEQH